MKDTLQQFVDGEILGFCRKITGLSKNVEVAVLRSKDNVNYCYVMVFSPYVYLKQYITFKQWEECPCHKALIEEMIDQLSRQFKARYINK